MDRRPRFTCCVCWRRVPWSKGCADDADEVCSLANVRKAHTTDTGICDDCWCALGGADLVAAIATANEQLLAKFK